MVTVTYAHHSLIQGNRSGALDGLVATVLLALVFTGLDISCMSFFSVGFTVKGWPLNNNYSSATVDEPKLSPYWITGFADAESSFSLKFSKSSSTRSGWNLMPGLINKRLYSTVNLQPAVDPYWVTGFCDGFKKGIKQFSYLSHSNHLSLVVWGVNLSSTVGNKFTRKELAMVQLPPYQYSVVIGIMLSDAWCNAARKNARLGFAQSRENSGYFWFVFGSLSHYCSSNPSYRIRTRSGKQTFGWEFFTRSMPCLTELHSLFYPAGKKVIPFNIYDLLTPVALAHLIQGDGQTSRHGLILCTNSYSIQDVVRLINALVVRYRLECNIREYRRSNGKLEFMIYIRHGSMPLLLTIVKPYMHPSMLYKIENCKAHCPTKRFATKELSLPGLHKRLYSTINLQRRGLDPYWVTGFLDGESSCFSLRVAKKSTSKIGWGITPDFRIHLHIKDVIMLRKIHFFFGVGTIYERESNNTVTYVVQSLRDITNVIIPHFDKYPLITQKGADYLLFKQGVNLLNLKVHSKVEGIREILSLKGSMNKEGLSDILKINFPAILPVTRPEVRFKGIPNPNWFAGFVDGEGSFSVDTTKAKTDGNFYTQISFSVSQHVRDELLLTKFVDYLGCGRIVKASNRPDGVLFIVSKFTDIKEKVIPFFNNYHLLGVKSMDYRDFCLVAKIIEDKLHLTPEGFKKVKSLKSGMNSSIIKV